MAAEELQIVHLKNDFYRDGFLKVMIALGMIIVAIVLLISISIYLIMAKPKPVFFAVDTDWRIQLPVPVTEPYLKTADLVQWLSEALPTSFTYDFLHYSDQLKNNAQYFTPDGWKKFTDILGVYLDPDAMQKTKMFVNGIPGGAPFVVNQGVLEGKYAWWLQMPIKIRYTTIEKESTVNINLQILVIRIPTLNNLAGVAIENVILMKGGTAKEENQNNG